MTDPTHFHNFAPCKPVQYDGTNAVALHYFGVREIVEPSGIYPYAMTVRLSGAGRDNITPGQWIVKQGDRVWVQDEEPPRVVEVRFGQRDLAGRDWPNEFLGDSIAGGVNLKRPVLSNGWTGPWEVVE